MNQRTRRRIAWFVAVAAVLFAAYIAIFYKRATVYECTACFADNPTRCHDSKGFVPGTEQPWLQTSEIGARISAQGNLCLAEHPDLHAPGESEKEFECENSPEDRFAFRCRSWKQWIPKEGNPGWYLPH